MRTLELCEQETTIVYDRAVPEVTVFTAIRRDQTKLRKAGISPAYGNAREGFVYKVPLSRLRWRVTSATPSKRGFRGRKPLRTVDSEPGRGSPG